jgi:hypothetical protein
MSGLMDAVNSGANTPRAQGDINCHGKAGDKADNLKTDKPVDDIMSFHPV